MGRLSVHANRTLSILGDDHIVGSRTAAITLVAYCDFECPYCGRAYPIINRLRARLNKRLQFVFRHFPLTHKHPHAQRAAEAAEATDAQGQFWAMHDLLFENQDPLTEEELYVYAESLGLDTERFDQDLREQRYAMRVARDIKSGRRNGMTGTPTFFLNGFRHTDEETLEDLVWLANERGSV